MKFAYSLKQKTKIVVFLFSIMACTILIRFLEDKSISDLNRSFASMYNDRLVPATDLFFISGHVHAKRILLDDFFHASQGSAANVLISELREHNRSIDLLISKFEKTLLVDAEEKKLMNLKAVLSMEKQVETAIVQAAAAQNMQLAENIFIRQGKSASAIALERLSDLMRIQSKVGKDMIRDSEFTVSGSKIYSGLQIALAVLIGILVIGIIFTSNVVKINNEKFRMN